MKKLLPSYKSNISLASTTFEPSIKGLWTFPLPQPKATLAAEICFNSSVEKLCKTTRSTRKQSLFRAVDHSKSDHHHHQFLRPRSPSNRNVHACSLMRCGLKKTGNVRRICVGFCAAIRVVRSCRRGSPHRLRQAQTGCTVHADSAVGNDHRRHF